MHPDPKAAEDFATLVLVTARTLRRLIYFPLNMRSRDEILTELNDALAPFEQEDEPAPLHDERDDDLEVHDAGGHAPPVYTWRPHDPDCKSISGHDRKRCDCSLSRASLRDDNCELPKTPEPNQ